MRRYDLVFIIHPDRTEEEVKAVTEKYIQILTAQQGTLIKIDDWGKRRLAYEINKQSKGTYILLDFYGPGTMIKEIERNLKIDDNILRYLTVKTRDPFDSDSLEEERKKEQLLQESQMAAEETAPMAAENPEVGEIESEKEEE